MKKIISVFFILLAFIFCFNFVNAGNSSFCQYNAFKDASITTCSNWYSSDYCSELVDECTGYYTGCSSPIQWSTQNNVLYDIPNYIPIMIAEVDDAFYFNQTEVWILGQTPSYHGSPNAFTIELFSPITNRWYNIITETDFNSTHNVTDGVKFGGDAFDGVGDVVFYNDYDGTILSYTKVRVKVTEIIFANDVSVPGFNSLRWPELVICMQGYNSSELAYSNFSYINFAETGDPCLTNDDCDCQLCEYGYCSLRSGSFNCIINGTSRDDCCLSGECSDLGYCTKETLWQGLDASKDQQFGNDTMTNNFISLFFIIAISGFLMFHGNIIGGVFGLYILSIFFAIIGWLSPFILMGMIVTGLIAIVFKTMLGHGTE